MNKRIWITPVLLIFSVLFLMVAGYCGVALLQAASLYSGLRLETNVRFWGSIGATSLFISLVCSVWLGFRVAHAQQHWSPLPAESPKL